MPTPIVDQVVDFYYALFESVFSEPFRPRVAERLRRDAVTRQVAESAAAASQSLTRFFVNLELDETQVGGVLTGFAPLRERLKLADIANSNIPPESLVENLLVHLPCPRKVQEAGNDAAYRVALHSVVQVLMHVGPVMAEWQKLEFSSTFELPRRIVQRLNQISEQLDALGTANQDAADRHYEILHRDYLLQRFYRVEAGTVRMTTNLDVDLRELFVMPRVRPRPQSDKPTGKEMDAATLMDLAAARQFFGNRRELVERREQVKDEDGEDGGVSALEQVRTQPRNVIVGAPGGGKSTLFEWLQLKIASGQEELVLAGKQAIPLLLRVRQLNPLDLPQGAMLIERATVSKDRARLMPDGWIDRQMKAGRVIVMLDGLDETEPELRDRHVIPWLQGLCRQYPKCHYLVSSRPVGYPPGALRKLKFTECDLLDFTEPEIAEYTHHWCTAVRLAQNEPEEEARTEGEVDGMNIVVGFQGNPYIRDLARNPLMLSAICLVNYFEGGQLPKDRAMLYKLCVEGLLHHWDQSRGIRSEFGLEEKLRACREVAIEMQANDLAEYEAKQVKDVFARVLNDAERAEHLLEHIRYRTGLLLERRAGIFAFAHLTFQEYLAALAVHEGNRCGVNVEQLAREHNDARWREVIVLYCGLAPANAARTTIMRLIEQPDPQDDPYALDSDDWINWLIPRSVAPVLTEAYFSAESKLVQDHQLRRAVLARVATAPAMVFTGALEEFLPEEVAPVANSMIGRVASELFYNGACMWLSQHSKHLDLAALSKRLQAWRTMPPMQVTELVMLLHKAGKPSMIAKFAQDSALYSSPANRFYAEGGTQADVAIAGLSSRSIGRQVPLGVDAAFLQILRVFKARGTILYTTPLLRFLNNRGMVLPRSSEVWTEFVQLSRDLARNIAMNNENDLHPSAPTESELLIVQHNLEQRKDCVELLNSWADSLEQAAIKLTTMANKTKSSKSA